MMTLKIAMIAMMIGGSTYAPMHTDNMNKAVEHPAAQVDVMQTVMDEVAPVYNEQFINQDKTYEECMNEAFERIYEEVNRLLDQIPEKTKGKVA